MTFYLLLFAQGLSHSVNIKTKCLFRVILYILRHSQIKASQFILGQYFCEFFQVRNSIPRNENYLSTGLKHSEGNTRGFSYHIPHRVSVLWKKERKKDKDSIIKELFIYTKIKKKPMHLHFYNFIPFVKCLLMWVVEDCSQKAEEEKKNEGITKVSVCQEQ